MGLRKGLANAEKSVQTSLGLHQTQCLTPFQTKYNKPISKVHHDSFQNSGQYQNNESKNQRISHDPQLQPNINELNWLFMPRDQAQRYSLLHRKHKKQIANQNLDRFVSQIEQQQEQRQNNEFNSILKPKKGQILQKGQIKNSVMKKIDDLMEQCSQKFGEVGETIIEPVKMQERVSEDTQPQSQISVDHTGFRIPSIPPVVGDPQLKPALIDRSQIKQSDINLEMLYNPKIEQVKYFEYKSQRTGTPIEMYFVEEIDVKFSDHDHSGAQDCRTSDLCSHCQGVEWGQDTKKQTLQIIHQHQYGFSHYHYFDPSEKRKLYFSEYERCKMLKRIAKISKQISNQNQTKANKATFQNDQSLVNAAKTQLEEHGSDSLSESAQDSERAPQLSFEFDWINQQMLQDRVESLFNTFIGPESDEHIKKVIGEKKKENFKWLSQQYRYDGKAYMFTTSGYSFKTPGQKALEDNVIRNSSASPFAKTGFKEHSKPPVESQYAKKNLSKYLKVHTATEEIVDPAVAGQASQFQQKVENLAAQYEVDLSNPDQRLMSLTLKLLEKQSALDFKLAVAGPNMKEKQANTRYERIRKITHDYYLRHQIPILVPNIDHLIGSKQSKVFNTKTPLQKHTPQPQSSLPNQSSSPPMVPSNPSHPDRSILKRFVQEGIMDSSTKFNDVEQREIVIQKLRQESADEVLKLRARISERQRSLQLVEEKRREQAESQMKVQLLKKFTLQPKAFQERRQVRKVNINEKFSNIARNVQISSQNVQERTDSSGDQDSHPEVFEVPAQTDKQSPISRNNFQAGRGSTSQSPPKKIKDDLNLIKTQKLSQDSNILSNLMKLSGFGVSENKKIDEEDCSLQINDQADDIQNLMGLRFKNLFNQSFGQKDLGLMSNEELMQRLVWKN